MALSSGIDGSTGKLLTGLDHLKQSLRKILATRVGTRVMLREFGSAVPDIVDRPTNQNMRIEVFAATIEAVHKWEPRFRISKMDIVSVTPDGVVEIMLSGTYYPRGHFGDYETREDARFPLTIG